jgi:hypothetical protein
VATTVACIQPLVCAEDVEGLSFSRVHVNCVQSVEDVLSRLPSARDLVCVMASCKTLRDYVLASKLCVSLRHSLLSTECPRRMTHQEVQDIAHRPVASLQSHLTSVIHALPSALFIHFRCDHHIHQGLEYVKTCICQVSGTLWSQCNTTLDARFVHNAVLKHMQLCA